MIHSIKILILPLFVGVIMVFAISPPAFAAGCGGNGAKGQVLQGVGQTNNTDCSGQGVNKTIKTVVNLLSYFAGVLAVIMIIVAGFRYITSGGSSDGVSAAKSTLIYAVIGLAVAALAQIIVQFVLGQATK